MHSSFLSQFRKHILALFATIFFSITAISQDNYRIIHWDLEQGLSFGMVNCMIKDQLGFVWMGTVAGLDRFDGSKFLNYFPTPGNKNTILAGGIVGLTEDSLHNIWIGTHSGLSRYDIKADSFTNYTAHDSMALTNTFVVPFWATRDEVYCVESASRITAYDVHTLARRVLVNHFDNDENKDYPRFSFSVLDTNNHCIWMLAKGGLMEISLSTRQQIFHSGNYGDAPVMRYDLNRKLIWINSTGGLLSFTINDKKFHSIESMTAKDYEPYPGLSIDFEGRVWAATVKKGILIYNPKDNSVSQPFLNPEKQQLVSQSNMCIYCDRLGITWTGNWALKGVYQLNPYKPAVRRYAIESEDKNTPYTIGELVNSMGNKIWIGTDKGLKIFDPNTSQFKNYTFTDYPEIRGPDISPMFIDTITHQALIRTGPPNVLIKLNLDLRKSNKIIFRDSLNQDVYENFYDFINIIVPVKEGWLIYLKNQGIFYLKKDSIVARQVIALRQENVTYAFASSDGRLFLRLYGTPFNRTYINRGGEWTRTSSVLDSLDWFSIYYKQSDHTYWVGGIKKLIQYNNQLQILHVYGEKEGFPSISALCILEDFAGNIWFNNSQGDISRLSANNGKIITLSAKDGLLNQRYDWNSPHVRDAQGDLYFAGNTGIDRISPSKLQETYPPSFVYLHSLEVNSVPLLLPTGLNHISDLTLKHFQNNINLELRVLDFFSTGSAIRYKIGGVNENWQYSPPDNPVSLDGVAPGNYKVSIQASNAFNDFNGPEKTILIQVSPPWWKTWWSYGSMVMIAAIILWTFIQYRSRRLKIKNRDLEEKVLHRTKELKHSLEELKETQAQLIQREKMASLGELTAGIAHEIQNPLNFVNNFSEVNMELAAELNSELSKMDLKEKDKNLLEEIAENITENEQKINHHGKRADAIVKGMLQHSRASAGRKEPTDINSLADEYLRLAYHGMRAKNNAFNATIKTDFDESIGKMEMVGQDISRVFLNLYNNTFYSLSEKARRGLPGYNPTIKVSTRKLNDNIEIRIRDNGLGIPEKIKEKIFQPFFTTKPTGQGTGLGLSLSFDIIKAHGGDIGVESRENEFAEFIIRLPVKPSLSAKNDTLVNTNNI